METQGKGLWGSVQECYQYLYSERISKSIKVGVESWLCWNHWFLTWVQKIVGSKIKVFYLCLCPVCLLCYSWRYRDNLSLIFSLEATWVTNITEPQSRSVIGQTREIIHDDAATAGSRRVLSVITKQMLSSNDTNRTSSDQLAREAETEFKQATLTRTVCSHSPHPCIQSSLFPLELMTVLQTHG